LDEEGKVSVETWNLVKRLPPSPIIFKKILNVKNLIGESGNWNDLLN